MKSLAGLERSERTGKPENIDELPAGIFCEECKLAVFYEDEDLEGSRDKLKSWLDEHAAHGRIWAVVQTEDGDVVSVGLLAREH
jgi:hypothetical protein